MIIYPNKWNMRNSEKEIYFLGVRCNATEAFPILRDREEPIYRSEYSNSKLFAEHLILKGAFSAALPFPSQESPCLQTFGVCQ